MGTPLSSTVSGQLTLSRAGAAARTGELDRAARLLDGLDEQDRADAAVLDLRARIHAQQGELVAADRCWARLQAMAPHHRGAAEGRRVISRITKGAMPARPRMRPGTVVVAAVAATSVLAAGAVGWGLTAPDRPPVASARPESDTGHNDPMARQLAALEAERNAAERRERVLDTIAAAMPMPGVIVHRGTEYVELAFETGLCAVDAAAISADGAALLREIGRRLADLVVTTTVIGHTIATPGDESGGSWLGLARAETAVGYLIDGGKLPLTAFTVASADQQDGPFDEPARNRTVTLLLRVAR
ncbi:hypothetical protein [Nocardia sp. NPDC052112]|uniref:hypothetical protein n=1 Tax=Nocardia sp. NPDC052112 TaxID=3155646 RepID=UPI003425B194